MSGGSRDLCDLVWLLGWRIDLCLRGAGKSDSSCTDWAFNLFHLGHYRSKCCVKTFRPHTHTHTQTPVACSVFCLCIYYCYCIFELTVVSLSILISYSSLVWNVKIKSPEEAKLWPGASCSHLLQRTESLAHLLWTDEEGCWSRLRCRCSLLLRLCGLHCALEGNHRSSSPAGYWLEQLVVCVTYMKGNIYSKFVLH